MGKEGAGCKQEYLVQATREAGQCFSSNKVGTTLYLLQC